MGMVRSHTRKMRVSLLAGVAIAFVVTPTAYAQSTAVDAAQGAIDEAQVAPSQQGQAADIVVTGSRIGRSGFTTPTPVTVLNADQLTKAAPSTIADSLRTLPALTATSGPQRASGTQGGGQSFLNLRNLGATRT